MKASVHVDIKDMARLAVEDNEAYALNRHRGFGASDSSILLGLNHWTTKEQLINQKNSNTISEEELAIGQKPQVRMGADLEPLILQKASEFFGQEIIKPSAQYRFDDFPFLTINFDGAMGKSSRPELFPVGVDVEAKCVSTFARKYWGWDKSCIDMNDFFNRKPMNFNHPSLKDTVTECAKQIGIPDYYYTQVQQQLMATDAEYAVLAALDVKEWQLHIFKVYENTRVQEAIIAEAAEAAESCKNIEVM